MLLLSLFRRDSEYVGHHATERRAPSDAECIQCDKTEPGTSEAPVTLAKCGVCEAWFCTACFTMHMAPADFYKPQTRRAWWLRVIGRG